MPLRTVLVAGATGLVGASLVRQLAAEPGVEEVRALVRRPLPPELARPRVREVRADFERLEAVQDALAVDAVFCALGTTIRQAGTRERFRHVDHDYPLLLARLARAAGVPHFLLVSSQGASATSSIFYARVKGELEEALEAVGFPSLTIARPSLLLGPRREFRLGERVSAVLGVLSPPRWRPVHADRVAAGLIAAARAPRPGRTLLDNRALRAATPRAGTGGD